MYFTEGVFCMLPQRPLRLDILFSHAHKYALMNIFVCEVDPRF